MNTIRLFLLLRFINHVSLGTAFGAVIGYAVLGTNPWLYIAGSASGIFAITIAWMQRLKEKALGPLS